MDHTGYNYYYYYYFFLKSNPRSIQLFSFLVFTYHHVMNWFLPSPMSVNFIWDKCIKLPEENTVVCLTPMSDGWTLRLFHISWSICSGSCIWSPLALGCYELKVPPKGLLPQDFCIGSSGCGILYWTFLIHLY